MEKKYKLALGCGGLSIVTAVCGTCGIFAYMKHQQDQETYGPLAAACDGTGVEGAAAYAPGPGPPPAIVIEQGLTGGWSANSGATPDAWLSEGVADAQLVICRGETESETVGTCNLPVTRGAGRNRRTQLQDFNRTRQVRHYRLVAAATGETVAEGSLHSEDPVECYEYTGNNPSASDFSATVPPNALERWLERSSAGETDEAFSRGPVDQMLLVSGTAGGPRPASELEASCAGSIPAEPQHRVTFDAPSRAAFMVLPDHEADTTIAIRLPDGRFLCNDDYDGVNPGVEGQIPAGEVQVFVGTYSASAGNPTYRLRLSQGLPPTS